MKKKKNSVNFVWFWTKCKQELKESIQWWGESNNLIHWKQMQFPSQLLNGLLPLLHITWSIVYFVYIDVDCLTRRNSFSILFLVNKDDTDTISAFYILHVHIKLYMTVYTCEWNCQMLISTLITPVRKPYPASIKVLAPCSAV